MFTDLALNRPKLFILHESPLIKSSKQRFHPFYWQKVTVMQSQEGHHFRCQNIILLIARSYRPKHIEFRLSSYFETICSTVLLQTVGKGLHRNNRDKQGTQ